VEGSCDPEPAAAVAAGAKTKFFIIDFGASAGGIEHATLHVL
jgi:hypothetical protein